jgi:hypothetical protein
VGAAREIDPGVFYAPAQYAPADVAPKK